MALKEAVMIILDVGSSMTTMRGTSAWLEHAVKAVTLLVHQKILVGAKDEVGLILFGTEETKNDLESDGYNHVVVLRDLVTPDVELLREIENIRPVVDALVVAMDLLVKKVGTRNYQKRVFLITDAGCDVNQDDLGTIMDKFNQIDAVLNVIGVDFADADGNYLSGHEPTDTKKENEALIGKICERVKGRVIPIQNALDLLSFVSKGSILQRSNFRGWFEISRHVKIPVWSFTKTKEEPFPRLAKVSKLSQESANPGSLKVTLEKTYHPVDDPDRVIEPADLSKGYRYGKTLVPFDKIDAANLKFTSTPCLQLLGFCRPDLIPRHHFMGPVDAIVPLPADDTASQALSAIIHAMKNTNSLAVVRFVKRANSAPILGVLSPHISEKHGYECLYFNKLPFMEDLRQYQFAPMGASAAKKSHQPTLEQLDSMQDLINSMDLTVNARGEPEESLDPKLTYNPALQHFFSCAQSKALHPERPLPPVDPVVDRYVNPDREMVARAKRALDGVKQAFPLVRTEEKEKQSRRRFWSDAFANAAGGVQLDSYVNDDAKRQKLHDGFPEGGDRLSIQSLITEVTDVGSATPVEDFFKMISRRDVDLVDKAVEQMRRLIAKLVFDSVRDSHYSKAIECLKALRKGCIEQNEVEAFNQYIVDVKKNFRGTRRDDFWVLVQSEKISLITAEENVDSEFSLAEANAFLTGDMLPGHLVGELDEDGGELPPVPQEDTGEDLFDMIE